MKARPYAYYEVPEPSSLSILIGWAIIVLFILASIAVNDWFDLKGREHAVVKCVQDSGDPDTCLHDYGLEAEDLE